MKTMKFLMLILLALPLVAADKREAEVDAVMAQLTNVLQKPDAAVLSKLLGDQLVYSHSNGRLENKKEVIEALAVKKTSVYGSVVLGKDRQVTFYGDTALVRQETTMRLLGAEPRTLTLNILYVWVKGKSGWQLVGRQATRLAEVKG